MSRDSNTPRLAPKYLQHKIWLGRSFLENEDIRTNLIESSQATPKTIETPYTRIIWIDHEPSSAEKEFAAEYDYEIRDIHKMDEDLFIIRINADKTVNYKDYIIPQPEELIPNYGRRSDILRLLLLKKFGGLYSDTDEVVKASSYPHIYEKAAEDTKPQGLVRARVSNSVLYSPVPNSDGVDHVLKQLFEKLITQGYAGYAASEYALPSQFRKINNAFKPRIAFTIKITGPGIYGGIPELKSSIISTHSAKTWFNKNTIDEVEKLKDREFTPDQLTDALKGTLTQEALLKVRKINVAKFIYILCELGNHSRKDAKTALNRLIEEVYKERRPWTFESLEDIITEDKSAKELGKILKYRKNDLTEEEKRIIVLKFSQEQSYEDRIQRGFPYLYTQVIRYGDLNLLQNVCTVLKSVCTVFGKNCIPDLNVLAESTEEIFKKVLEEPRVSEYQYYLRERKIIKFDPGLAIGQTPYSLKEIRDQISTEKTLAEAARAKKRSEPTKQASLPSYYNYSSIYTCDDLAAEIAKQQRKNNSCIEDMGFKPARIGN